MLPLFLTLNSIIKKLWVVHLWALKFSTRCESWNGAAKVESQRFLKGFGKRQMCKMDTEPISQKLVLEQRNYKDIFLSVPYLLNRNIFQEVSTLLAKFRGLDIHSLLRKSV